MCLARASDRVKERSHSDSRLAGSYGRKALRKDTWKVAEERLLLGVTSHVSLESIAAGMIGALASAVSPFTGITCSLGSNVIVLDVGNELVTVGQITDAAAFPRASGDLVGSHGEFVCAG